MAPTFSPADVKPDIRQLAVNPPAEGHECFKCYTTTNLRELGDDESTQLFKALLMSKRVKHATLRVCPTCRAKIDDYYKSIRVLEEARIKFNEERNNLGRKIFLRPEGKSKEEFDAWEMEINSVEDFFPSRVTRQRVEELEVADEDGTDVDLAGGSAEDSEDLVARVGSLEIKGSNSGDEEEDKDDADEGNDRNVKPPASRGKNVKPPTSRGKYPCSECGKVFPKKCNLDDHMVTHSDERPFHCDVCNKSVKLKKNLIAHKKTQKHIDATNAAKYLNCV